MITRSRHFVIKKKIKPNQTNKVRVDLFQPENDFK